MSEVIGRAVALLINDVCVQSRSRAMAASGLQTAPYDVQDKHRAEACMTLADLSSLDNKTEVEAHCLRGLMREHMNNIAAKPPQISVSVWEAHVRSAMTILIHYHADIFRPMFFLMNKPEMRGMLGLASVLTDAMTAPSDQSVHDRTAPMRNAIQSATPVLQDLQKAVDKLERRRQ